MAVEFSTLPIKQVFIDWNRIEEDSYLRRIPAIGG